LKKTKFLSGKKSPAENRPGRAGRGEKKASPAGPPALKKIFLKAPSAGARRRPEI
jgi:hypothetical protein